MSWELEQSRRDRWPGPQSAFGLWISHYRMKGASHLYAAAQRGWDRLRTYPPLIMNVAAVKIVLSLSLNYFHWAVSRLQNCDTHNSVCNLRAVPACLPRPPINASFLHLFISFFPCFLLPGTIVSLSKEGKNTNKVIYRLEAFSFGQTLISVFKCGNNCWNVNQKGKNYIKDKIKGSAVILNNMAMRTALSVKWMSIHCRPKPLVLKSEA